MVAPAALSTSAEAAVLKTFQRDYGANGINPIGVPPTSSRLQADRVQLDDQASDGARFNDGVDFSGLSYQSISAIDLTVRYESTDDVLRLGWFGSYPENWYVRAQGSGPAGQVDDDFRRLDKTAGVVASSFTFDASSDGFFTDVFAHSVVSERFEFWFSEASVGSHTAWVHDAEITIRGTAQESVQAVPTPGTLVLSVPAMAGLVLLAACGWIGRREQRATV